MKIADIIRRGIAVGASTEQILAAVRETHPTAKTNAACVAYYRSKEKAASSSAGRPIAKAAAAVCGAPTYSVKGIKTFVGMEGHGYNATLYRDGRPVAFAIDDASGGPLSVEWKVGSEESLLAEHVAKMPPRECKWADPSTGRPALLAVTSVIRIEELVNVGLLLRDVAKMTKGKVAFIKDGKLYTSKVEPTEAGVARIRAANPGCVVLNGMDDLAVLAAVRALS